VNGLAVDSGSDSGKCVLDSAIRGSSLASGDAPDAEGFGDGVLLTPWVRNPSLSENYTGAEGSIARALTEVPVSPVLMAVQLPPPLVLLKTPVLKVPAYSVAGFAGSIASARMSPPSGPLVVRTWTPAETVEAVKARPTRTTTGRRRRMRSRVAFFMGSLLRDNQNAATFRKSLAKH
jgi:hypothetical protein